MKQRCNLLKFEFFQNTVKMSATDAANPGKAAASHPPYLQMIKDAIIEIGNKKGSSR